MKFLIIVFLSISVTYAHKIHFRDGIIPQKFPPIKMTDDVVPRAKLEELRSIVENENSNLGLGFIQADVTNYTLSILAKVSSLLVHEGLDPMELSETHFSLFPGSLDLTNGFLQDLSTITLFDSVIAKYTRETHILELTLPLGFDTLLIDFDYHVQILLVGISGTIDAKVSNLRLDLHMGFNFSEYHAFVDHVDVKNSGSIDISFTGLGLLDWIIDIMSGVLTTFLHGLILSVVDLVIYFPVQSVVNSINDFIDNALYPNGTTTFMMN